MAPGRPRLVPSARNVAASPPALARGWRRPRTPWPGRRRALERAMDVFADSRGTTTGPSAASSATRPGCPYSVLWPGCTYKYWLATPKASSPVWPALPNPNPPPLRRTFVSSSLNLPLIPVVVSATHLFPGPAFQRLPAVILTIHPSRPRFLYDPAVSTSFLPTVSTTSVVLLPRLKPLRLAASILLYCQATPYRQALTCKLKHGGGHSCQCGSGPTLTAAPHAARRPPGT